MAGTVCATFKCAVCGLILARISLNKLSKVRSNIFSLGLSCTSGHCFFPNFLSGMFHIACFNCFLSTPSVREVKKGVCRGR